MHHGGVTTAAITLRYLLMFHLTSLLKSPSYLIYRLSRPAALHLNETLTSVEGLLV